MADNNQLSAQVHHAIGMVAEQAHCDVAKALDLLKARADALNQTVDLTARFVVEQVVRFDA